MRTKDTRVAAVAFVGSIGTSPHLVRSLRRNTEPDDTAWCVGDGWWLSTSEG